MYYCAIRISGLPQRLKKNEYKKSDGFVVHEWGVIQQDVNGKSIAQINVPDFVHRPVQGMPVKGKPILFFYSPKKINVKLTLTVKTRGDSFICWYPNYAPGAQAFRGVKTLVWDGLEIIPQGDGDGFVNSPKDHWWTACRKTDAAVVKMGKESERFLFYESTDASNWKAVAELEDGKAVLSNSNAFAILDAILIINSKESFVYSLGSVKSMSKLQMTQSKEAQTRKSATALLRSGLRKAGMYEKEISTFLATWKKDFIDKKGARLLYRIPDSAWEKEMGLKLSVETDSFKRAIYISRELNWEN